MSPNDITRLACEAGIPAENVAGLASGRLETGQELLAKFAELVATAATTKERERCSKIVMDLPFFGKATGNEFWNDKCKSFALLSSTLIRHPNMEEEYLPKARGGLFSLDKSTTSG